MDGSHAHALENQARGIHGPRDTTMAQPLEYMSNTHVVLRSPLELERRPKGEYYLLFQS